MKMFGVALVCLLPLACSPMGNYRVVKKVPTGGEVALEGDREIAQAKAQGYMASSCPSGYDVLEEGEAVVGSSSQSQTQAGRTSVLQLGGVGLGSRPATNTATETVNRTEWRVKFQCKGAAPVADPATAAAPKPQARVHEVVIRF
jgi:hypothetical protein